MELARLTDEYGDVFVAERTMMVNDSNGTAEEGEIIDAPEGKPMQPILAKDALKLIDSANLNTTANELRTKLEESKLSRDRFSDWLLRAGCSERQIERIESGAAIESDDLSPREIGVGLELAEAKRQLEESRELFKRTQELIEKHEKLAEEQNSIIADAHQTIAQLRKADTVRPGPSLAEVFAEGFRDGYQTRDPDGYTHEPTNGNPYEGR